MEPEVRAFLKRVLKTVSAGMLFLLFHMTAGLYFNWAFFEGSIRAGNIIYYVIFLLSLSGLIYYLWRLWKGTF
jgi:NADH:ubiquinone oxidoreductase subunit 3 (subunit A)